MRFQPVSYSKFWLSLPIAVEETAWTTVRGRASALQA